MAKKCHGFISRGHISFSLICILLKKVTIWSRIKDEPSNKISEYSDSLFLTSVTEWKKLASTCVVTPVIYEKCICEWAVRHFFLIVSFHIAAESIEKTTMDGVNWLKITPSLHGWREIKPVLTRNKNCSNVERFFFERNASCQSICVEALFKCSNRPMIIISFLYFFSSFFFNWLGRS